MPTACLNKREIDALVRPGAEKPGRQGSQAQPSLSVTVLENLAREKFNPYGHTDVDDSADYVTALRKQGRKQSDDAFLD